MSLVAFQSALARAVLDPSFAEAVAGGAAVEGLTPLELRRLAAASAHKGLATTHELHAGWRLGKVLELLPLTTTVLGDRLAGELKSFWAERPPRSLSFQDEAIEFAARLAAAPGDDPYVGEVAGYEGGRLELLAPGSDEPLPRVREVRFAHEPGELLARLADGEPLDGVPEEPCLVRGTWTGEGEPAWTVGPLTNEP